MEEVVFENIIKDKKIKEYLADLAISILAKAKIIDVSSDLKHSVVEFGYLFKTNDQYQVTTMFKLTIPKKAFKQERVFYFGMQKGRLYYLNEKCTEELFRKVQRDMFRMHKVDVNTINKNDYIMELY